MSPIFQKTTMPENTSGPTIKRRYSIEITAQIIPGEEPTAEQIRDFFNAFFSEGFENVWRAATCDKVKRIL